MVRGNYVQKNITLRSSNKITDISIVTPGELLDEGQKRRSAVDRLCCVPLKLFTTLVIMDMIMAPPFT